MISTKQSVGVIALLAALFSGAALAQQESLVVTDEQPAQDTITYEQTEVVQEVPDYRAVWLNGQVSLIGGEYTTSERQYLYAKAHQLPAVTSQNLAKLQQTGHLVRLTSPKIIFSEVFYRNRGLPYVLPATRRVILEVAADFQAAGCGRLVINDVLRLDDRKKPKNASPHSVHPYGMAVDIRIIHLSDRCYGVLESLLGARESQSEADVTREYFPPHFHVVVVPDQATLQSDLVARYLVPDTADQSK